MCEEALLARVYVRACVCMNVIFVKARKSAYIQTYICVTECVHTYVYDLHELQYTQKTTITTTKTSATQWPTSISVIRPADLPPM